MAVRYETWIPSIDEEGEWVYEGKAESAEEIARAAAPSDFEGEIFVRELHQPGTERKFQVEAGCYCNVTEVTS